ncbi:unnamed protein product [Alternaria alternata]
MTTPGGDCQGNLSVPSTVLTNFTSTIVDQWDQTVTIMGIDVTTSFCTVSSGSSQCGGTTEIRRPTSLLSAAEFGPAFAIYWRASDLSLFPTDYASSLASVIDVPFGNSTAGPTSPASGDGGNSGLSPGAIAGIAVGVATLIILGVVALLFLRRRRKRQTQEKQRLPTPAVAEMQGESTGLQHFVGGKWRAESDAGAQLVEAGSRPVTLSPKEPVELDSTQRSRDL